MKVTGTYTSGVVRLDESVQWPDGIRVNVDRVDAPDICCDGSEWDDSPGAARDWAEWVDALEPVFDGEELERFGATLRAAREEQDGLLSQRIGRSDGARSSTEKLSGCVSAGDGS